MVRAKRVSARLVSLVAPATFEAEQYRSLRVVIEQMHPRTAGLVVAVSSPVPGDGKSLTAANLAGALAQNPAYRVLLAEVDLRRPSLTDGEHLELDGEIDPALIDLVLEPELSLDVVVRRVAEHNLYVLPAGTRACQNFEVLSSPRFAALIAEARRQYDFVVLDCAPLVPVPDCRAIAHCVDGFLVVVAAHRTPRRMVEEALGLIEPEKVIGLVFNEHERFATRYYGYYAPYSYAR